MNDNESNIDFDEKIAENLENLQSLDELNDVQKYLRKSLLLIGADGDKNKYIELNREYDIKKTKDFFYKWLSDS